MKEQWKDISWYEWLYQVSNLWEVKSIDRKIYNKHNKSFTLYKGKIIKSWDSRWYRQIKLCRDWKTKHFSIHRLIGTYFIENPENKPHINHIDWNRSNNDIQNLEWCTHSENMAHSIHILWNKTWLERTNYGKGKIWKDSTAWKPILQYNKDWTFIKKWDTLIEASKTLGINRCWISNCLWKRTETSGNFIWKFLKNE